jgi:hypothetical protein
MIKTLEALPIMILFFDTNTLISSPFIRDLGREALPWHDQVEVSIGIPEYRSISGMNAA